MADLSDYTSLRVGGPAKKFVEVSSEKEIIAAIESAGDSPVLIMGGGTNLLISDEGFSGTVIRISNNKIEEEVDACSGATLTIGAGENWDEFVKTTISRGFAGLKRLAEFRAQSERLQFKTSAHMVTKSVNSLRECELMIVRKKS